MLFRSEALKTIYSLIWDDFCSWYLEWVKPGPEQKMNRIVHEKTLDFFEELMQLLHPFMPFVTEEIFHQLRPRKDGEDLVIKPLTAPLPANQELLSQGLLLKNCISSIRDLRNKQQIKPKETIELAVEPFDRKAYEAWSSLLCKQVNASQLTFVTSAVPAALTTLVGKEKFYVGMQKTLDPAAQKDALEKELNYHKGFLQSVEKKLSNERFVQQAKPEVIALERKKKEDAESKIRLIEESLRNLN